MVGTLDVFLLDRVQTIQSIRPVEISIKRFTNMTCIIRTQSEQHTVQELQELQEHNFSLIPICKG